MKTLMKRITTYITNWWIKYIMQKKISFMRIAAPLLFSALFFLACENPNEIGFNLVDGDGTSTTYTDTLSIDASTILLDSAYTSDNNFILSGNAEDPLFGNINATAYLQPSFVSIPSSSTGAKYSFTLDTTASVTVFDSLVLRLVNSGIMFGDSVTKVNFGIFRLKNGLSGSKRYTNFESEEYNPTPLRTFSVNIDDFRKKGSDSLLILRYKLPHEVGVELSKLVGTTDNATLFKSFPGFAIAPISGGKCIYGLNVGALGTTTSTLQYFYHVTGKTTVKEYDFDFSGPRYTHTKVDRSNTPLKGLVKTKDEISSKSTNGLTYLQGVTGVATKLKLKGFNAISNKSLVNQAVLTVEVNKESFNNLYKHPIYYTISKNGDFNRQETSSSYVPLYITQNGKSNTGQTGVYTDTTRVLRFDVTSYLQNVSVGNEAENGVLVLPATFYSTSGSLFTNDNPRRAVLKNPKLLLYYRRK